MCSAERRRIRTYFLTLAALAAVAAEGPRRGEFAELVADHVLGHEQLDEVLAVVDRRNSCR